jgi:hypothetical protein
LRTEVEEEEMGRACSTHARYENYIHSTEKVKGKDLSVDAE